MFLKFKVRGAPAIAIVGCLSLAVELTKTDFISPDLVASHIASKLEYLVSSRPTAVNMKEAADRYTNLAKKLVMEKSTSVESVKKRYKL